MARPLRIEYEHAIYHVYARGHRKEHIFRDNFDKKTFLEKLSEVSEKFQILVHCYVLMDNHYHLLITTPNANLSRAMHQLNVSYSNWYKAKYKIIGSVFQGRFNAVLIESEDYMMVLSAYIHLNPVRSGLVKTPEDYPWSSFLSYVNSKLRPGHKTSIAQKKGKGKGKTRLNGSGGFSYLFTEDILEMFSGNPEAYRRFVYGWIGKDVDKEEIFGKSSIIGSEEFRKGILSQVGYISTSNDVREKPDLKKLRTFTAEEICKIIAEVFEISEEEVYSKKRGNVYKKLYLYGLKNYSELRLKEIGNILGMDYSAVSQEVRRFVLASETDEHLRTMIERIKRELQRY